MTLSLSPLTFCTYLHDVARLHSCRRLLWSHRCLLAYLKQARAASASRCAGNNVDDVAVGRGTADAADLVADLILG
jgi:hypothetical protein